MVQRGYTMSAWKKYDAWYNSLYGMCGPYPNLSPSKDAATVACESAEAHCGYDGTTSCMLDYIRSIISSGSIEMCRGNYNLMVTTGDHDYYGWIDGVVSVYDGNWAHCIFYCIT